MKRHIPSENTGLVIAVSIAFFGTLALLGWSAGVFAKLDEAELWILAGFVAGFAALTYVVDDQVRATLKRGALVIRGELWRAAAKGLSPTQDRRS